MSVVSSARWVNLCLALIAVGAVLTLVWSGRSATRPEAEVRRGHLLPVFRQEEVSRIELRKGVQRSVLVRQSTAPGASSASAPGSTSAGGPTSGGPTSGGPTSGGPTSGGPTSGGPTSGGPAFAAGSAVPVRAAGLEGKEEAAELGGGAAAEADPLASEWSLTEPFETDADPVPVDKLLGSLRYATWEREVPEPPAAAGAARGGDAGVSDPLRAEQVLAVEMGSIAYRLRLGEPSVSPPGARYVEVSGGGGGTHTYVVKKSVLDELFVPGDSFRGRQIVPYRKGSTARLVLSSAAGVRRLRRVGDDYHFDGMQEDQRARRAEVERIFLALARASADPLLGLEEAKAALSTESSVRVAMFPSAPEKAEASLEFGGICPSDPEKAVAVRSLPEPLAGCVDKSVLFALREPASSLIDSGLFGLRADEVEAIRIVEGEQVLDFAREGDGFLLRQPRSAALDADAAKDRLARLLGIDGTLLVAREKPPKAAELNAAIVTLESSARPGAERSQETVRVGPARADGSRLVYREADAAVILVPREETFALRADATLLKEHRIFDYALKDVRGISVVRGTFKQVLKRTPEGAVTLLEPQGFDVDGGIAVELIDQLRTLRAVRWVSDSVATGFGLEKPRISVRLQVEVDGRAIERTLLLGRAAAGGFYASVDRDPGVFVAPRALDRTLSTLPLDRAIFSAERSSIVELALTATDRGKVLLKRVAGQLTIQKGSSSFDPERLDELLDVIETLRPEAAVHTGVAGPGEGLRKPILTLYIRRQAPENVGMPPIRFSVGSRDVFQDASIYYARHASVNASYALPRSQVQRLLDLF